MKSSPNLSYGTPVRTSFISLNAEIITNNTEFVNLHGPFVYIMYAEYSDISKRT